MPHTLTEQHTNKTPSTNDNLNITSASTNRIPFCFRLLPFVAFIVGCHFSIRHQILETCDFYGNSYHFQSRIPLVGTGFMGRWVSEFQTWGKLRCPAIFPRCLGVFGEKSSILRFRVCRIRDETFTQQSRSVGGQCFTTFFSSRRFFGGMLEESGVVMGKVVFKRLSNRFGKFDNKNVEGFLILIIEIHESSTPWIKCFFFSIGNIVSGI